MAKKAKSKSATADSAQSAPTQEAKRSPKKSKKLEIAPIAREALMSSRRPKSPLDQGRAKPMSPREVDAIRKFALALAEDGLGTDEDNVLICSRITEPAAIPITELLYDRCTWCDEEIYYDRLMPAPPNLVRVCVPCGIMLLEADKKGRN
jgi:hypothetical protein